MVSTFDALRAMFQDSNNSTFCTHVHCGRRVRAAPFDPVVMRVFTTHAPSFPWRIVGNKCVTTRRRVSYTCTAHAQDWINYNIAVEVFDAVVAEREVSEVLFMYTDIPTLFINSHMYTEMPVQKVRSKKTKVVPYLSMPLECTKKYVSCVVCYEDKNIVSLQCKHTICYSCLRKIKPSCPYCRAEWKFDTCKRVKDLVEIVEC